MGEVVKLAPSSYPVTNTTTYSQVAVVEAGSNFGVAADPSTGDVYVDKGTEIVQHDSSGKVIGRFAGSGAGAISGSEGVAVLGSDGLVFAGDQASSHVKRYGPAETQPPVVGSEWASSVTATEATLNAEINPEGSPASYGFEYGTEECALGSCQSTPELPLGSGEGFLSVKESLTGLAPNTTYHFRVKVTSGVAPVFGPDRVFHTGPAPSGGSQLLDNRAYELVSPTNDNNAEFGVPFTAGGFINSSIKPQRAAGDGQAVAYASFTALPGAAGSPPASYYLSRRGSSSWTTDNITPPGEVKFSAGPIRGFTQDLAYSAVVTSGQQLTPDALAEYENIYRRNNISGALEALTTEVPTFTSPGSFCIEYMDASEGAGHIIFSATGGLTPDAQPSPEGAPNLYDWSATSGLHLVNIFPDETPAVPKTFDGFGAGPTSCGIGGGPITRNSISADGSRIFWTYRPFGNERELFVRVNAEETIQLDAAQGGPDPSGGGEFLAASTDGLRAFFTDQNRLVPGAAAGDLYEYDLAAGELRDLTVAGEPAEVLGLLAAADDGSYLYFVARGVRASGAEAGKNNLYVWHEGETTAIGVLSPADESDWNKAFNVQTARVTPDGTHLAFRSVEPLTGYDSEIIGSPSCERNSDGNDVGGRACPEVFLYDATSETLRCASCNPNGSNPVGETPPPGQAMNDLPKWQTPTEQPRYLSDGGSRLFFESYEALVPRDTNQRQDIYEFELPGTGSCTTTAASYVSSNGGCVQLLTSGASTDETYFVDASSSGDDVFFSTREALVPADEDNRFDVYDARVDGIAMAPPPGSEPCSGEACRSASATQGPQAVPGSSLFAGPGNVKRRKCHRGKVRRHGRCVKRRHRPKHRHHSRGKKRTDDHRSDRRAR